MVRASRARATGGCCPRTPPIITQVDTVWSAENTGAAAQIDQIGNQVCTAFDDGQTFTQVKVTGLSMIPAGVSVPVGTDDWAVRKAVALYCPGHANKLV